MSEPLLIGGHEILGRLGFGLHVEGRLGEEHTLNEIGVGFDDVTGVKGGARADWTLIALLSKEAKNVDRLVTVGDDVDGRWVVCGEEVS